MREKPVIIHVIDSLQRGGAETLLINLLPVLNRYYDIILVTLIPENDFDEELIVCKERYCLQYKGATSILASVFALRKIIKKHRPAIVRAQLYTSSLIARLATPKKVPFVFSIHTFQGIENYTKNRFSLPVEKITYNKRHHLIGVSKQTIDDFDKYVGIKGPSYTLYNFINSAYFERSRIAEKINFNNLRLIAVGNLKAVKNYSYLLEAFKQLKHLPVYLDIYGDGPLESVFQHEIEQTGVKIALKGVCSEIYTVMPAYDLYVMSSLYEGFGIAPIEAMATGLPLLLSDLPVLREITHGNALFFDQLNVQSFVELMEDILGGKYNLQMLSVKGIELARIHYQQDDYVKKLNEIYQQVIGQHPA